MTARPTRHVVVFGGSSYGRGEEEWTLAETLGRGIAQQGWTLEVEVRGAERSARLLDSDKVKSELQRRYERLNPGDLRGGQVGLLVFVGADGKVVSDDERPVLIYKRSGRDALDSLVRRNAESLEFNPGTVGGLPLGSWVELSFVFKPPA